MKRKLATRKLERVCIHCGKSFRKGEVYYQHREVIQEESMIFDCEYLVCAKCNYQNLRQKERFDRFKTNCVHPQEFRETVYSYIHGEAVKEPSHTVCRLCGECL